KNETDSTYWNGQEFTPHSTNYVLATLVSPGALSTEWRVVFPTNSWITDKYYSVKVRSYDRAENNSLDAQNTFTHDSTLPRTSFIIPSQQFYNYLTTISGTAWDEGPQAPARSRLKEVRVAIQNDPTINNLWWDGTGFNSVNPVWLLASGNIEGQDSAAFYFTGSTPTWVDGKTYLIQSRAQDRSLNYQSPVTTYYFTYDITKPTVRLRIPEEGTGYRYNSLPIISGTAADTSPGELASVYLRIREQAGLYRYWNNQTQQFDDTLQPENAWFLAVTTVTPSWTIWFTTFTAWQDGMSYSVEAKSYDKATNLCVSYSTSVFTYDISAPKSYVGLPANLSYRRQLSTISGTATDTAGGTVVDVKVFVKRLTDNRWWAAGSWSTLETPLPNTALVPIGVGQWRWERIDTSLPDNLTSGASYYIYTRAYDDAGNIENTPGESPSIMFWDVTSPTSTVTYPQDGGFYSSLTTISGTQADVYPFIGAHVSGVPEVLGAVKVSIQDLTYPSTYWQYGVGWVDTEYFNDAVVYTSSWVFTNLPTFISGRYYKIRSRAYDASIPNGNDQYTQFPQAGYTILFDTHPPVASVTYPQSETKINFIPTISGTAVDYPTSPLGSSGIDKVFVAIREIEPVGLWWDPQTSSFTSSTPKYSTATWIAGPPARWEWQNSGLVLRDGYKYYVQCYAQDKAGNVGAVSSPILFRYDISPPQVSITLPYKMWHNSLTTVSGTAQDTGYTGAGISEVQITYQHNPPAGLWWDGVTFSKGTIDEAVWETADISSLPYWWKTPVPSWSNGETYKVVAKAKDKAGNWSELAEKIFSYDIVAPLSQVTFPQSDNYYSSVPLISGTCYDANSGVEKVEVRIVEKDPQTDNITRCWYGSLGWQVTTISSWVVVNNVWQSSWSYTTAVSYLAGKKYEVTSRAWDVAGSSETETNIPSYDIWFIFDDQKPQTQIVTPIPTETQYYRELVTISGTAKDNPDEPPVGSGIDKVEVAIQKLTGTTAGNWWSGVGFTESLPKWDALVVSGSTTWSAVFNNANWEDNNEYLIISRAKDKAITSNIQDTFTVGVNSVTFVCDKSTPTSQITWPTEMLITNSITTISGTALDPNSLASGVSKVWISILKQEPQPQKWYNPITGLFDSDLQLWCTAQTLVPSNTSYILTGFASGLVSHSTYVVYSKAFDRSLPEPGNYESNFGSSRTFVYDITRPTSVINLPSLAYYTDNPAASPLHWLPLISGTAFDQFGISKVEVLIRDLTYPSTYWTGTQWISSEPSDWPDAVGSSLWQFTTIPTWLSGRQYRVYTKATDVAGNIESRGPSLPSIYDRTFIFDNTPPVSRVTYPQDGGYYISPTVISGTAADPVPVSGSNVSGILYVKVIIKRLDTNQYWDGTSWVGTLTELDTVWVASEGRWYKNTGLPEWQDGVQYQVQSRAYDNATNPEPEPLHPGSTWKCDKTPPQVYLQRPVESLTLPPNKYYNTLPTISGTAYDANPLAKVEVRIWSYIDGGWWDGTGWNMGLDADSAWLTVSSFTPPGDWTLWYATFTSWMSGYVYRIEARAWDTANNYSTVYSTAIFRYDTTKPETYISFPQNATFIGALTVISGTAKDLPEQSGAYYGPSGLYNIRIAVRNNQTGLWWSGTGFTALSLTERPVSGLDSWTFSEINSASLVSGVSYYITARAEDNAGNPQSSVGSPGNREDWYSVRSVTFTFDNTAPISKIEFPADNGAYNTPFTILSGTSVDATAGVNKVEISIQNLTDTGVPYWNHDLGIWESNAPVERWITISTSGVGGEVVRWVYQNASIYWTDGRIYRVRVRGYDNVTIPSPNVEVDPYISSHTFIYDTTKPTSTVLQVRVAGEWKNIEELYFENVEYIGGSAADNAHPLNNSGIVPNSGVKIVLIRDENENEIIDTDGSDLIWDFVNSTWTAYTGTIGANNWGVCSGGEPSWQSPAFSTATWRSGKLYFVRSQATDRAGNVQDYDVSNWRRFYVTLPANSFVLTPQFTNVVAGTKMQITVKAVDINGDTAKNYTGRIRFTVDGLYPLGAGPEYKWTNRTYQPEEGWLPDDYTFTLADKGVKTFYTVLVDSEAVNLVKSGVRTIRVTDIPGDGIGRDNITGATTITVLPATPEKLRVVVPGVSRAAGIVGGLAGLPAQQVAGVSFDVKVDACDRYWNIVPSTSTTVRLKVTPGSDPYTTSLPQQKELLDGNGLPQGTTTFTIFFVQRGNQWLTAEDLGTTGFLSHTIPQPVPVNPATAVKLQVILPGETAEWGKPPYDTPAGGKVGLPTQQVAGVTFDVQVNACDYYWNRNDAVNPTVKVITSDKYDVEPTTQTLVNGTTTFQVTLITAATYYGGVMVSGATHYIYATVYEGVSLSTGVSSGVFVIPTTAEKLLVILPGETPEPGSQTGKLGTPQVLTAGVTAYVDVYLVDAYWNRHSTATQPVVSLDISPYPNPDVSIEQNPAEAQLVSGYRQFAVVFKVATGQTNGPLQRNIVATDTGGSGTSYTGYTTPAISVSPAQISKLQLIVPGETVQPGIPEGKTGTPTPRTAGVAFNVTVRSCDEYWNHNPLGTMEVKLLTTDPYDTEPVFNLVSGQRVQSLTLRQARPTGNTLDNVYVSITAVETSTSPVTSSQTVSGILVIPNNATRLQLVLPGETAEPGHPEGKTGNVSALTAGTPFTVIVNLTDNFWNRVALDEPVVRIQTPNDPYDVEPQTQTLQAGQYVFTNAVNIVRAGTHTVTVEDYDGVPPLYVSTTSRSFYVSAKPASQLQVLVPDQQNVAGNWSGSPNAQLPYGKNTAVTQTQTAGVPFTVTVNACDTYWNITTTNTIVWIQVMKTATEVDPYATVEPASVNLINTATFTVVVRTAQPRRIKVTDGDLGLLDQLGEVFNVNPNVPSKIFVILPGETADPGSPTGKYGTPLWQEAGYSFMPTVRLVDDYYNPTPAPQDITVRLTTEDPYDSYTYGEYIDYTIPTNNTDGTSSEYPTLITATTTGWRLTADDVSPNIYTTYVTDGVKVKPRRDESGYERKLLVTLPGEVAVWGKPPYNTNTGGKSGIPQIVTAGLTFSVTVYACDYYWNRIDDTLFNISPPEGNPVVSIQTSDPYDTEPSAEQLVDGRKVFNLTLVKAGTFTVTVSDIDGVGIYYQPYTTPVSTCQAAAAVKLLAILPAETYLPGSPTGKTGVPQQFTAGVPFNITVYGCDQYWNLQPNAVALVRITDSDVYNSTPLATSLVNGQAVIQHTFVTAGTHYILVEDIDSDPLASYTVPVVTVTANVPTKLLAMLPGETYKPGKYNIAPYGKEGTPITQTAGVPFNVTVYATDDYYNRASTFVACWLTTQDPYDVEPSTLTLVAGTTVFQLTFVSATDPLNWNNTGWTVSVYAASTLQSYASAGVPVQANPSTTNDRLQLLLPGEVARAGKPPYTDSTGGKEGVVQAATAGDNVLARIYVCDYYWNRRTDNVLNVNLACAGFQDYEGDGKTPKFATLTSGASNYYLVFYTTGSWSINVSHADYLAYNSSLIQILPAAANKLLVVLPGEEISSLSPTGRTGTPQNATAGMGYNVKVYACDAYYNYQPIDLPSSTVKLTTSDNFDVEPANLVLQYGTTTFIITPVTAGTQTVTVEDLTPPIMASNISSVFTVVPNNPARLLVLVPGETILPGSPTGKQGTPVIQTAGVSFGCTVYATDLYYNPTNDTSWVRIDTSDKWDIHPSTQQLVNGTTVFFVTLVTAGQQYLYAVDTDAPYLYTSTSSAVTVQPKIDVLSELKLHIIVPGETYEPGKWENGVNPPPYGKEGTPSAQVAGNNFTVDVYLVDKFYNRVYSGVTMPWVQLVKVGDYDPYAVYPSSKQLEAGTTSFVVQFRTSGWALNPSSWTITARDVDGIYPFYPDAVSPKITVLPNIAKKLQIILPGETWIPGSSEGRSGMPESWVVDSTRTIIVQVCDDYWNVTNTNITATLTTEDPNDTPDPQSLGITNGRIYVDRNLVTATTDGWRITVSATGLIEYVSPKIVVNPGLPVRLLALVPNETYSPGSPTGKTGTVVAQQAGVPFTITVLITDSRWNLVSSTSALIGVTTEDPYDVHPATKSTTNGVATFDIEFRRGVGESYRIFVTTAAGNELQPYITPPIQSNYGAATKLQILVPGETAVPGRWYTYGKDGTPTAWYAGELYPVVVNVVDKYWNPVPVVNTTVRLSSTDPYYEPPQDASTNMGTVTIYTSLVTATTVGWQITASTAPNAANPYLLADTSPNIRVLPGRAVKLLVLAPGEQSLPGSPTGKQGTPVVQVAGSSFTITVHATDSRWNIAESSHTIRVTTDDLYDTEPSTKALITTDEYLSIATFTLTLITANRGSLDPVNRNTVVTAEDVTPDIPPSEKLANGQTTVPVTPQPAQYLMLLVPGQTHVPGKPPYYPQVGGKDGQPQTLTAGVTYYVTVAACDLYWNINPNHNPLVKVWTSDPYDTDPTPLGLENGIKSFPINLRRATLYQGLQESLTIWAQHNADPQQYASAEVGGIQVLPEPTAIQLLILVPNEQHEPGSPSGKTGSVIQQTAGVGFDVVVNCVDRFNNIVPTAQPGVTLTSSDPNDGVNAETGLGWDPCYQPLINGTTVFRVTLVTASTWHYLTAEDTDGNPPYYGRRDSSLIWVNPGPPVKLQCLLPGETPRPNTTRGKEGTPNTQVAGQPFNVKVRITDVLWNLVPSAGANVKLITPYDDYDTEPTQSTVNGEAVIEKTIYTASQERTDTNPPYWEPFKYHIIIATDTGGLYWTNISSTFTVTSSSFTRLHVILPGEQYIPGKPPYDGTGGKSGTSIVQTAGVPISGGTIIRAGTTVYFNVAVFAVDNYYNLVYSGQLVSIITSDPYDTHPSPQALNLGYVNFANVAMVTSSTWTVTAQASGVNPGVSSPVFIKPNVPTRLAIYAPGETPTPGYTAGRGRTGTPSAQTAGAYFDLTVRACDAYYNLTTASPTATVLIDDWDIDYEVYRISRTKELINGTTTFTVRLAAAKVTVASATASGYLSDYTGGIPVNPDTPYRLLILPPGVTVEPGKPPYVSSETVSTGGIIGTPLAQTAGVPFNIIVRAVDKWWNRTSAQPIVTLESNDPWDYPDQKQVQLTNGEYVLSWTLVTRNDVGWYIRTVNSVSPTLVNYRTANIRVNPNSATSLRIYLPGETPEWGETSAHPSATVPYGISGTPINWTAGVPNSIVVNAVDNYNNRQDSDVSPVKVTPTDPFVSAQTYGLENGSKTYTFTLVTAGTHTFLAEDQEAPLLNSYRSSVFTVNVSSWGKQLHITLPGETYVPGQPPYDVDETNGIGGTGGKVGTPTVQTAGVPFVVTVRAVDSFYNLLTDEVSLVRITPSISQYASDIGQPYEGWIVEPSETSLVGGVSTFTVTLLTAHSTWTLTAEDVDASPTLAKGRAKVYVKPNNPVKLQVIVPDEVENPGSSFGRVGSIRTQTAGVGFTIKVNLCDAYWNRVKEGPMPLVSVWTSDPYDIHPTALTLVNGQRLFTVTLVTASSVTITASGGGYTMGVSSEVPVVPNVPTKLLVVVPPQQQVNGKWNIEPVGRTNVAITTQTAGVPFNVTIYAVDNWYNFVSTVTQTITVITSDDYDTDPGNVTMVGGVATASIDFRTAKMQTVTAVDNDPNTPSLQSHTSSLIPVQANVPKKLHICAPGEIYDPGRPPYVPGSAIGGKQGTPTNQTAGSAFDVVVRITDDYWNLTSILPYGATVQVNTNDPYSPSNNTQLVIYSSAVVSITLVSASSSTADKVVYIEDIDGVDPTLSVGRTQNIFVGPGTPTKLLLVLPGQTLVGGHPRGKTGQPQTLVAGQQFTVTCAITDAYFNPTPGVSVTLQADSPLDNYDTEPSPRDVDTATGKQYFDFTLVTAATHYLRVRDVDGVPPLYQEYPANPDDLAVTTFTVRPADAVKLQLILPGETPVPGKYNVEPYGKTGYPVNHTAGELWYATVRLVDAYYNLVTDVSPQPLVHIRTADPFDIEPSTEPLVLGQGIFPITLRTAATWHYLVVEDVDGIEPLYSSDTSPMFTVNPSTPTRLLVVVPNETFVQGSPYGKTGVVQDYIAGQSFVANVYLVDDYNNRVRTGWPMPTVGITTWDPKDSEPSSKVLIEGLNNFTLTPLHATSSWTLTAVDVDGEPPHYSSGTSSFIRVWPAAVHHMHIVDYPQTVVAGTGFSAKVQLRDQYDNLVSTGVNWENYANAGYKVKFDGEYFPPPQTPELPSEYDWVINDYGERTFSGIVLKRAGQRWIKTYQTNPLNTLISSERPCDPNPNIQGEEGEHGPLYTYIQVQPGPPASFFVVESTATAGTEFYTYEVKVPAGTRSDWGKIQIIAYLSDAYANIVPSSGVPANIEVIEVVGSTGVVSYTSPASDSQPPMPVTYAVTDSSGAIGLNPPLYYYGSHTLGDSAKVKFSTGGIVGVTRKITTIGGTPYRLAVLNPPTELVAGNETPYVIIQRRDEFDNPTYQGDTWAQLVTNSLAKQQQPQRQWDFRRASGADNTLGPDYVIWFYNSIKSTSVAIIYYDEMSSIPEGEDGRPTSGKWTIQAQAFGNDPSRWAQFELLVKPDEITKAAFDNPQRRLTAGSPKEYTAIGPGPNSLEFEVELQDRWDNPVITTYPVVVLLSTIRQPSRFNDSYSFSLSSRVVGGPAYGTPPVFETPITSFTIEADSYYKQFYYLDTNASENYGVSQTTYPIIIATPLGQKGDGTPWADALQPVIIMPDRIRRIGVYGTYSIPPDPAYIQTLTAGVTSQVMMLATEDFYGNIAPILEADLSADNPRRIRIVSDSTGTVKFALPSTSSWTTGEAVAYFRLGDRTTTFYLIDTLASVRYGVYDTTHTLFADTVVNPGLWTTGVRPYRVLPNIAHHPVVVTPPRRLIAGTTIQFDGTGSDTSTMTVSAKGGVMTITKNGEPVFAGITVEIRDEFENVTISTENITLSVEVLDSPQAYGSIDPSQDLDGAGWTLMTGGGNLLTVLIPAGNDSGTFYYFDTVVGSHTMKVSGRTASGRDLVAMYQQHYITPAPIKYFTIHHPFNINSPLRVHEPGLLTVKARDRYGNVASGDSINGQWYEGTIVFTHSGNPEKATLKDAINLTTYYTFVKEDAGVYNRLQLIDQIQETLKVFVIDYATIQLLDEDPNKIYGYTGDILREVPVHSDGDVVTCGIVVEPADLAPVPYGDPDNPESTCDDSYEKKQELLEGTIYQGKTALFQGDGNTYEKPAPVPMLRLNLRVLP
ncbi:MAG: hypothetical protein ABIL76_00175, partial [candidate division WOR-3 bacterium]